MRGEARPQASAVRADGRPAVRAAPQLPPRQAAFGGLSRGLLVVATIVLFAVSGGMLWKVGINYEGLTGNGPSKIHPSTYLICLLFGWMVATSRGIVESLADMARRRPASLFLMVSTLIFFVQIIARSGPGMAGALDTFLPAALMVMLLSRAGEREMRGLELVIHVVMGINALMALGEFVSGHLVFPYRFDGDVFSTDTRSTALQGHPLVNATITASYVLALLAGGGRSLSASTRLMMMGLQCLALVTFGGRSAMVVTVLLGGGYILLSAHRTLSRGRVSLLAAAGTVLLVTLIPVAIVGLSAGGFFDALLLRFVSDGGSANARVEMLDLFGHLSWRDLLVGPDPALVDSLRRVNGLEWGIENPIIRTVLYQGIIITALQTVATVLFFMELGRLCGPGTLMPMASFILLINTSEGIGGKTTMLTKFAVMMLCFYRPRPRPPAPIAATRGPAPR